MNTFSELKKTLHEYEYCFDKNQNSCRFVQSLECIEIQGTCSRGMSSLFIYHGNCVSRKQLKNKHKFIKISHLFKNLFQFLFLKK